MTPITFRVIGEPAHLVLPYPPTANLYWRHCNGRTFVSADANNYRRRAATIARVAQVRLFRGPVAISIDVYRPRRVGDLDNTLKVLLDSLRGIAFEDDSQIVELSARRFDDKDDPRAEVCLGISARQDVAPQRERSKSLFMEA
jgi:crossover junction endodeoxyribonuclease RusA